MATTIQHAKPTQHAEPITEENLYTILGFKDVEDFENQTNRFIDQKIWQLFIQRLEKEIYAANKEVVKNIVCAIAKSHRGNAFTETERIILNEKQGSKKREKAIGKAIDILKEMYPTKALEELSIIKRQAEGFLKTDFYQAQSKPLKGFVSGAQLFADTLEYIQSLEESARVEKKELIEIFLLDRSNALNKKRPELQVKREDAIRILSSDELREIYNKGIEEGTLQPLASYQACEISLKKLEKQHPEEKSEVNPYAILGFKGKEDFENQVNEFIKKEIWSLVIDNFEKEIDSPNLKVVIASVMTNIARNCSSDAFAKTNSILLYKDQDSKGRKKAVKQVLDILKKIDPEQAFNELSTIKKQAEECCSEPSGAQFFAETLKYIQSLENLPEVKKEELIGIFLSKRSNALNEKHSQLQVKREDAIKTLKNDELRGVYNKGVEEGTLQPLASYQACETSLKKLEKQHPEEKSEINPYAILGFKGREDFENQVNEFTKKEIWSLVIGNFEKAVDLPELKVVMEIVISKIARSCNDNEFLKIDPISLYGKEDITGKRKKEITKVLDILKKIDPEQALNELSIIKKQAEDSLEIYQADLAKFNNQPYTNLSSRDKEAGLETLRQKELCMKTIEYVKSLETLVVKKATRGELVVTNFLLNHIKSLNNKLPNSQSQIEGAMKILVNDELVKERDQSVETENLPSLESYEECKAKIDKMEVEEKALEKKELVVNDKGTFPKLPACANKPALPPKPSKKKIELALKNLAQIKNPDLLERANKPVPPPKPLKEKIEEALKKLAQIENQENKTRELAKDLQTIDKSIVNAVNDIKKYRKAILNCKDLQNPYIKEKEEHPFRGKSCQKMIDIYQTSIAGYQEKSYQSLNQISELFKSIPQKIKNLSDVKEFQKIMDGMHKEHNIQQANANFSLALICLLNIRNKLAVQLEKTKDPSTDLRASHINTETKVTRL